jgi:sensor histidine kinase regulating citrate/malate metabolism
VQRKVVLAVSLLLFLFCAAGAYLWISNLRLKDSLKKALKTKAAKQGMDLQQHRELKEKLKKDLEEKYRADMISYQAVTKRLEQKIK